MGVEMGERRDERECGKKSSEELGGEEGGREEVQGGVRLRRAEGERKEVTRYE